MRLNIPAFTMHAQAEESGTQKKVHVGAHMHHQKYHAQKVKRNMHRIAHAREKNNWRKCAIFSSTRHHAHCKREEFLLVRNNSSALHFYDAKILGECKKLLRIFLSHFTAHEKARG